MDSVNRNLLYIKIECTVGKQGKKKGGGCEWGHCCASTIGRCLKSVMICKSSAKLEPKYSDTPSSVSLKHEST